MADPLVSFVIPTRNRPEMAARAVKSALAQTYVNIEVVVVVDGPEEATAVILRQLASPLLRVIALSEPVGGAEARNIGARHAWGVWIALLDDDDEALPDRIERQLACAAQSHHHKPIVSSRLIAVREHGEQTLPRRLYQGEAPADYLFVRHSLHYGDGLLHTSTLMLPRELLLACPFECGLKRHQDWDLILRVWRYSGVGIEMVPEPLARVQMQEKRNSVSSSSEWEFSLAWARKRTVQLGSRAYAAFLATECMPRAARAGVPHREQLRLLRECLRTAWFSPRAMLLAFAFYCAALRTSSKRAFAAQKPAASPQGK